MVIWISLLWGFFLNGEQQKEKKSSFKIGVMKPKASMIITLTPTH